MLRFRCLCSRILGMVSCLMTVLTQLEDVFYQRFFILIDVQLRYTGQLGLTVTACQYNCCRLAGKKECAYISGVSSTNSPKEWKIRITAVGIIPCRMFCNPRQVRVLGSIIAISGWCIFFICCKDTYLSLIHISEPTRPY